MNNIEKWIDSIFENTIPNEVVGIAFNLYEDETNQWSIEMIGSASFDVEDPDWACDEVFDTRDNTLSWVHEHNMGRCFARSDRKNSKIY